jgi:23S rRNA pseudouridine2605 synthase
MKRNPDQGRRGGARKGRTGGTAKGASRNQPQGTSSSKPASRPSGRFPGRPSDRPAKKFAPVPDATASMRLNRYIAQAGLCSRREADVMIGAGVVSVNGEVITELGKKVDPLKDVVRVEGDTIRPEAMRYILINKPKNLLSVEFDPQGRRTVMDLLKNACKERVSPVGRIEKEASGLVLFTNDGEMAKRLTHPKVQLRELYHVTLAKKATPEQLATMTEGFVLDEGFVKAKAAEFVKHDPHEIGMEIHSNRSRIVRRMWEHLGHKVLKVDRVTYGPLTKKDLPRGHWRFLTDAELNLLRMTT